MFKIITIGSVSWDVFFKTRQSYIPFPNRKTKNPLICFRYGAKIDPDEAFFSLGGGAANAACSFSRLGLKVAIFSKIGQDAFGKTILETFKKEKINLRLLKIDKRLPSALSFIIVGRYGERTIFPYAGAAGYLELNKKDIEEISKTQWIYLTTLRKHSQKILPQINRLVKTHKIKLAFNPGNTELKKGINYLKGIFKNTEVLLLNKEEAIGLVGSCQELKSIKIPYLLSIIKKWGPKVVVITDGERGSWVKEEDSILYLPAFKTKLVEKTGAGDAFGSGLVAGLIHFHKIKKALRLATHNAASVIGQFGATPGLLNLKEAQKIIKDKSLLSKIKQQQVSR